MHTKSHACAARIKGGAVGDVLQSLGEKKTQNSTSGDKNCHIGGSERVCCKFYCHMSGIGDKNCHLLHASFEFFDLLLPALHFCSRGKIN